MGNEETATASDVLNSWKDIAAYLEKDVRTVMRWERNHALPVHRLPGGPKAGVYALKPELDAWRQSRPRAESAIPGGHPAPVQPVEPAPAVAVPPAVRRRRWRVVVAAAAILLLTVAVALGLRPHPPKAATLPGMTRLTYERFASWPTISADGKLVAYTSNREGKFDIYLQQTAGHQSIRVTHNESDNWHPALSPDGSLLAFRSDRDGGGVYVAETIGGVERKIADRGAYPRFSPSGTSIVYLVADAFNRTAAMYQVATEGGAARPFQPDFRVPPIGTLYSLPMWSPAGDHILFEGTRETRGLWIAPAAGGEAVGMQGVTPVPIGSIRIYVAWAGSYLYYVEGTSVHGAPLFRVPVAAGPWRIAGPAQQLTSASMVCGVAAVSADGELVLQVAGSFVNSIWSLPLSANSASVQNQAPRKESPQAYNQLRMAVASNGSRFAYVANPERGRIEIRVVDTASGRVAALPLVSDRTVPLFRLSGDGTRLGYRDFENDRGFSYIVAAGNPARSQPVCENCSVADFFSNSPDVLLLERAAVVRQTVTGGSRTTLLQGRVADPVLSPDDRWLAFVSPRPDGRAGVFVAPVGDRPVPAQQWILAGEDPNFIGSPQWSPAGNLLYYVSNNDGSSCVWARSFDPSTRTFGEPIHVYHDPGVPSMKLNPSRMIGITPDRLYLMMSNVESNIWRMKVDR